MSSMALNPAQLTDGDTALSPAHRERVAAAAARMPAFTAIVAALMPEQPLRGARIVSTLPFTLEAAALAGALRNLGADLRWAAAMAANQTAPYPEGDVSPARIRVRNLFEWPDETGPNLLLEHGAAASRLIHAGTRREGRAERVTDGPPYSAIATGIQGMTETATRGARWLARRNLHNDLLYPAMDCSAIGSFRELSVDDRTLRASAGISLLLLSQIELFRNRSRAAELFEPPSAMTRTISTAHDDLLRVRIEKLRDAPNSDRLGGLAR
jgi:hypothetical protein